MKIRHLLIITRVLQDCYQLRLVNCQHQFIFSCLMIFFIANKSTYCTVIQISPTTLQALTMIMEQASLHVTPHSLFDWICDYWLSKYQNNSKNGFTLLIPFYLFKDLFKPALFPFTCQNVSHVLFVVLFHNFPFISKTT